METCFCSPPPSIYRRQKFHGIFQVSEAESPVSPPVPQGNGGVAAEQLRRRLREIYRLHEGSFCRGYDIVVVARSRAVTASYQQLERSYLALAKKLHLLEGDV